MPFISTPRLLPICGRIDRNHSTCPRRLRRFPQWTFLPILPNREDTLRACIREGVSQKLWAVAIGDAKTSSYQQLIESPDALDRFETLFDGSASLVEGDLLQLIREELHPPVDAEAPTARDEVRPPGVTAEASPAVTPEQPSIPPPARRLARVRLNVQDFAVTKTNNLQPYLFKVLQEQDAGALK